LLAIIVSGPITIETLERVGDWEQSYGVPFAPMLALIAVGIWIAADAALLLAGAAHRRVDASNPSAQRPGLRSPTWCRSARSWSSRSTSLCSGTGPRPERPMGSCSSRLSPSSSRPGSTTSGSASDSCSEVCSCWRECMSVRYVPRDRPRPESGFSACQRLSRSHGKGRCPKRRHLDPEEGGVSFDPKLTNCAFG